MSETLTVNGVEYVRKSEKRKGLKYVIVRTYSAGVFAGYLKSMKGQVCEITEARRLWFWSGAASLSQLAVDGTSKPSACKFPAPVGLITVTQAIEILDVTEKAQKSIAEVPIWTA